MQFPAISHFTVFNSRSHCWLALVNVG